MKITGLNQSFYCIKLDWFVKFLDYKNDYTYNYYKRGNLTMVKIVFIGAGSFGFTRGLVKDLLTFPALKDSTITLVDINKERLTFSKKAVERIVREGKYPAKVVATMNRRDALKGDLEYACPIINAYMTGESFASFRSRLSAWRGMRVHDWNNPEYADL